MSDAANDATPPKPLSVKPVVEENGVAEENGAAENGNTNGNAEEPVKQVKIVDKANPPSKESIGTRS